MRLRERSIVSPSLYTQLGPDHRNRNPCVVGYYGYYWDEGGKSNNLLNTPNEKNAIILIRNQFLFGWFTHQVYLDERLVMVLHVQENDHVWNDLI